MQFKIPYIYSSEELERYFLGVYKTTEAKSPSVETGLERLRRLEIARVMKSAQALGSALKEMAVAMPFVGELHPFYKDLLDLYIGLNNYRHALAKIGRATSAVRAISRETLISLKTAYSKGQIYKIRRAYIGRATDLIRDLAPELNTAREAAVFFRKLYDIDPELFTVVVSGAPNVGKSSLVGCMSTAKPKVAEYPFTTKQIHVGHIFVRGDRVQVIDTPGLLDRPFQEMNRIEQQAVLALRHLAKVIVFLVDPSLHSGYDIEIQLKIYNNIKSNFNIPIILVINKIDLINNKQIIKDIEKLFGAEPHTISAKECRGTEELKELILEKFYVPYALERLRRAVYERRSRSR
ncbi:NOG1 family protein [Thermoproteus tenax]|uniref:GTP-binding protein, GTP1/OBG family n=1 Tax=Thermoproteus tenax (strain ATCC 35583 / DSM 2078 / JCM 9277 / NBRC 100435 / Kra 1) TaxID=768679 RepID=G4RL28_THETK|nr:GTPase [Thermoproteus tenax]CCC82273.1 GTP-binding protein, GTP1/OBG family [Thermoproteus tenax Kra 1]